MTPGTDPAPMQASEFEAMAAVEDRHWWFRGKREIVTHLLRKAGVTGKILDAGCGTGGNLPALMEFGEAVGVEKDPVALEFARRKHGGQVVQGEMTALPFLDSEFDGIITTDVLEHVPDDRKSLSELVRVLKPGGTLLLTVPAHPFMWTGHDVVLGHARRYTIESFRALLATSRDVDIENVSYMNCAAFPAAAVQRWRRARREHAVGKPDLTSDTADVPSAAVNELAFGLFAAERWVLPHFSLPFGVSIVAVLRKKKAVETEYPEAHGEPLPFGWLMIAAAMMLLCAPILTGEWLSGHEGPAYLFRAAEFHRLFEQGAWYPRWCVDFYWGYGYPFFVFYPPGVFYLASLFMTFGAGAAAGIHIGAVISNLLMVVGSYRFASLFTRSRSVALAAAFVACLATYRFVQFHVRTDYAEALATGILPWVLVEATILCRRSDLRSAGRLAFLLAAVFYSHTITAVITSACLGLMGLAMISRRRPAGFWRIGLASAAGLVLAAAYWVPAMLEQKYVNAEKLIEKSSVINYDYADHFLYLSQRFKGDFLYGVSVSGPNDTMPFSSSWLFCSLGGAAIFMLLFRPEWRRKHWPVVTSWLMANFMMFEPSIWLWRHLPLLKFFQFPWRFLLLDAVMAAPLTAIVLDEAIRWKKPDRIVVGLLWTCLIIAAGFYFSFAVRDTFWIAFSGVHRNSTVVGWYWPWVSCAALFAMLVIFLLGSGHVHHYLRIVVIGAFLFALPCSVSSLLKAMYTPMKIDNDLAQAIEEPLYMQRYGVVTPLGNIVPVVTAAQDEYLPKTAHVDPAVPPKAPARIASGSGTAVMDNQYGDRRIYNVNMETPGRFEAAYFYYPGVRLSADGVEREPEIGPDGSVMTDLDAGPHRIEVWYQGSRIQAISGAVSLVGFICVSIMYFLKFYGSKYRSSPNVDGDSDQ